MEEQIRAEFKKNNFVLVEEEDILQKCLTFCINYNLSPSELVSSWDLYSINRQLELVVSDAHMDAFQQQLQSEQKQAIIEKEEGLHSYSDITMELDDEHEDVKEVVPTSPVGQNDVHLESFDATPIMNGVKYSSGKPLELVTPFGQRKNKFVIHSSLNNLPTIQDIKKEHGEEGSEDDVIKRVQPIKRCTLEILCSQPTTGCRYMYDKIENKFNYLEDKIMKYSKALVASQLYEEPVDPSVASEKSIFAMGMICCEEGRLKEKPVILQSSVEHSEGKRVRLDLQKLDQFSLFPGQVVGVEGRNPSGHCLIATKIIDHFPLSIPDDDDLHKRKRQALDHNNQLTDPSDISSDLSLIVASGPFTTVDNFFFEPLSELLAYARRKQPQLLILIGPFVDFEHPEIKKGIIDKSYDELFRLEILSRLQDYVEYMGPAASVILVPSIRDAHHEFVFPQPPFEIDLADANNQITCITNPGYISANEVKIGCCSVDVLKHLSMDVVSRGIKNRMNTLTNHLLSQRSFYPLYPPSDDTPLDLSLAPEALQMSTPPDILIVPSDLAQFVKVLSLEGSNEGEQVTCMCVNPGRLARGEGGGHFVELNFHGSPDSSSASVIRI